MVHLAIVETVVSLITAALTAGGLPALFGLMAVESAGIPPLPGEIILLFAGFLVASGAQTFVGTFLVALAGGVTGSFVAYAIGRYGRRFISDDAPAWRRVDPKHLAAMDRWFERWGEEVVGFARLVPLVRAYISYPAGTARMSPTKFGIYTAIGAAPFTGAILYGGYVLGSNWSEIVPWFDLLDYLAIATIVVLLAYVLLRWRDVIGPGFPPRRVPSAATPPPVAPPPQG